MRNSTICSSASRYCQQSFDTLHTPQLQQLLRMMKKKKLALMKRGADTRFVLVLWQCSANINLKTVNLSTTYLLGTCNKGELILCLVPVQTNVHSSASAPCKIMASTIRSRTFASSPAKRSFKIADFAQ